MRVIGGIFFVAILGLSLGVRAENLPAPCFCRNVGKDYDAKKGYYFDRVTWTPLPKISYKMECLYICSDKNGQLWRGSYIHSESRMGFEKGGIAHAKHFVCDATIKDFIPRYDMPDHIAYYDIVLRGDFPISEMSHRDAFKNFSVSQGCRLTR
jgi:hypothetical protein